MGGVALLPALERRRLLCSQAIGSFRSPPLSPTPLLFLYQEGQNRLAVGCPAGSWDPGPPALRRDLHLLTHGLQRDLPTSAQGGAGVWAWDSAWSLWGRVTSAPPLGVGSLEAGRCR